MPLPSRELSPNGLNGYVAFSYDHVNHDGHIWAAVNAGVLMQSMSMCPLSIGSSLLSLSGTPITARIEGLPCLGRVVGDRDHSCKITTISKLFELFVKLVKLTCI